MGAAGAPAQAGGRGVQELQGGGIGAGVFVELLSGQALVGVALALLRAVARGLHPLAHRGGGFTSASLQQVLGRQCRHLHVQVDAVEQRAAELALVAGDLIGRVAAGLGGVAQEAAGAGIHGGNELKPRIETMSNVPRPRLAVSYTRFSSGQQAKGSSLERQSQAFSVWLSKHPEFEPLTYSDAGVSAFRGRNKRKGSLSTILQLIEQGFLSEGDCLVIEAMDRLSRQEVADSIRLVLDVLKHGVSIVTLEDHQTYDKDALNGSRGFVLLANLQAAHSYSKRLGERVRAAHESKRAKARANEVPDNLVTVPWIKNGKLIDPFAKLVSQAVDLYLKGYGHRAITQSLQRAIEEDPILKARYDKPLHATTVKRWLKSPELVGDWKSKEGLIEGLFEPLLDIVTFQRLQNEIERRTVKPSKQRSYLLSGLVLCAECSSPFHIRTQKPRPTREAPLGSNEYENKAPILYCNCSNYLKNGSCSNNATWSYDVLLFIHWYGLSSAIDLYKDSIAAPTSHALVNEIELNIEKLKAQSERSEMLFEATGKQSYLDRIKQLKVEIEALEANLSEAVKDKVQLVHGDVFIEAFTDYNSRTDVEKNALLRVLEHSIKVDGKRATLNKSISNPEFEIVRRSQKYDAYIVKVIYESEDEGFIEHYHAVLKGGLVPFPSRCSTEEELLGRLKAARKSAEGCLPHLAMFE